MRQPILLGVDGGGTRCRVRATYADGTPIGAAEGTTANIFTAPETALANILNLSERAFAQGGLSRADFGRCHAGLGLAGVNVASVAETFRERVLPFAASALESDAVIACRGAFPAGHGGIGIVGTGTAYVAQGASGFTLFGGWGMLVSDHGGGADLGRRALAAALLALDGIGPSSPLTDAILDRFDHSAGRMVEFAGQAKPVEFGGFAPIVADAADAGDRVGLALMEEGRLLIEAALRRLVTLGAERIVLFGGLSTRYVPRLSAGLRQRLAEPAGDALDGALALAQTTLAF